MSSQSFLIRGYFLKAELGIYAIDTKTQVLLNTIIESSALDTVYYDLAT